MPRTPNLRGDIASRPHQNRSVEEKQRRHAERALSIACFHYTASHLETLAWCASGRPSVVKDTLAEIQFYQAARAIICENHGTIKPGDVERLLRRLPRRKGGAR